MVSAVSYVDIKRELTNSLRNADLISISDRGVTTVTETFSGDNVETQFTLTNSGLKNIRSITISAVSQDFGTDWDFSGQVVTFTSAPANGTDNISIEYDYSSDGDRIYPDFPKTSVKNANFPRIGFDIISVTSQDHALQGSEIRNNIVFSFVAYGVGTTQTDSLIESVRQHILDNKLSFYFLNFLTPTGNGPMLEIPNTNGKIFQRNVDFRAPVEFEV